MLRLCPPLILICLLAPGLRAETLLGDDFTQPARYEREGPAVWMLGDGRCTFAGVPGDALLIALGRERAGLTIEATIEVSSRAPGTEGGYALAGIACYLDAANHWRLLLVEGPDGKRYFEMVERLDNSHQAQLGQERPAARLDANESGDLAEWLPGRSYRLSLALTDAGITGTVVEEGSAATWQRSYTYAGRQAVTRGRAALATAGLTGAFHDFRVSAEEPVGAVLPVEDGPRGAVAVLSDESGEVAQALAAVLRGEGYGVTVFGWQDLEGGVLPHERLSAFVLADARRLSVRARDEVLAALHSQGRLLALGAPALSEILAPSPDGYAGPDDYTSHFAARLARTPLAIEGWTRGASAPEKTSTIERVADGAWRVRCDVDGWDTYHADVAVPAGDEILVLEARGDAATDKLLVECVERDESRWMAVVDVGREWRTCILRPRDFAYWTDSRSVGRGGEGDHLVLANTARVSIGLARSHMPDLVAGQHEYEFRGLSTSPSAGIPDPDFRVPDIEALCPSHKLYPLDGVARVEPAHGQQVWDGPGGEIALPQAYAAIWRERGRGIRRDRAWRWIPVAEATTGYGARHGPLAWMVVGDASCPGAAWASLAVSDPREALAPQLRPVVLGLVDALARGTHLLEGGAEFFSYAQGETLKLGAEVANTSREARTLAVEATISDPDGMQLFRDRRELVVAAGRTAESVWDWAPAGATPPFEVEVALAEGGRRVDTIGHSVERLRTEPGRPEEYVRVEGSNFTLAGKPWYFQGINYWPTWVAGCRDMDLRKRERYDPEVIEEDLSRLEAMGFNSISAVQAILPPDPAAPGAFRDQTDFLDRCLRHNIRVHFTVHNGRPYSGGDIAKVIDYIGRAGLREHPAILSWELAWEPIEGWWGRGWGFFVGDWNEWVVERYGSVEGAVADWGFDPRAPGESVLPAPKAEHFQTHGAWDACVAAFRRAFGDRVGREYGRMARALRAYDPNHLIAFRGGACGIPSGQAFAHIHSVGVAKHMDFLNPEGYNLQSWEWKSATPADTIRKGGLITQYYRFVSREKPVVWMEFGYTVNGIGRAWTPQLLRIAPESFEVQRQEYESFYAMFVESGARGAAPWWLPGGFRLGENSDFGLVEPDWAERPAMGVVRSYLPRFAEVEHPAPTRDIRLDLDGHYPDAWEIYSAEYLAAVQAGEVPGLSTAGTGTDSTTCPLTAVGDRPYSGSNPPIFLNAEYNRLEVRIGDGPWRELAEGDAIDLAPGEVLSCRASVGNLGEAAWLAPAGTDAAGRVSLAGRAERGLAFRAPIATDTPYLGDATVEPFVLLDRSTVPDALAGGPVTVSFEMSSDGRAFFGERRTVTVRTP